MSGDTTDFPVWVDDALDDITEACSCSQGEAMLALGRVLAEVAGAIDDGDQAVNFEDLGHRLRTDLAAKEATR